jgi:hypothetical protein
MVPFPKIEVNLLWKGYFIISYVRKLNDLHGRPMVNIASGATFYIYDKASTTSSKSLGWLSLSTMEDEIDRLLSRAESKFCTPNGGPASACPRKRNGNLPRAGVLPESATHGATNFSRTASGWQTLSREDFP